MKTENQWNPENEKEFYKIRLKKQIDGMETILSGISEVKEQSWTDKLLTKIIDNLQLNIKNVKIFFENNFCYEGYDIIIGISFNEINVVSAGDDWQYKFVENADLFRKLFEINNFSIFFKVIKSAFSKYNQITSKFTSTEFNEIFTNEYSSSEDSEFIINNLNAFLKFQYNRNETKNTDPKLLFDFLLGRKAN